MCVVGCGEWNFSRASWCERWRLAIVLLVRAKNGGLGWAATGGLRLQGWNVSGVEPWSPLAVGNERACSIEFNLELEVLCT